MKVVRLTARSLPPKADALIEFDVDSLRQVVAARQGTLPDLYVVDPDQYERAGRILRDSSTPRLLAYSTVDRTLYATDGCNSCVHQLDKDPALWDSEQIRQFSEHTRIALDLVRRLATTSTSTEA